MKVSICIPTYNQAVYLEQAILSGIHQTVLPVEIIVSNDCSTDNTLEVLERLSAQIPLLKVRHQAKNVGIAKNTDDCLRLGTGDFIVRLDSDDYLSPLFIEKLSLLLNTCPGAGYAHGDVQEIDQNGRFLKKRKLYRKPGFQSATDALKAAINGYKVAANIIMFKREALVKVNYITNRPDYVEDYHLSSTLAAAGYGNVYEPEELSFYRVWVDTGKVRQRRKLMEIVGLYRVFEEVFEPSYNERGWSVKKLNKRRREFASRQSDCLSWDVYSKKEKDELTEALLKLSSSNQTKLFIWIYQNKLGFVIEAYKRFSSYPKLILKNLLVSLKTNFFG